MITRAKYRIAKLWKPFTWVLHKLKIKPNYITAFSVLFAVLGAMLINTNVVYSMIFFAVAFFSDVLDGALAREYRQVTKFGAYFDSCVDRIIDLLFVYSLFVYVGFTNISILVAGFMPLISYFKHRADPIIKEEKNFVKHSVFDRAERTLYLLFSFAIYFVYPDFSRAMFMLFIPLCVAAMFEVFVKVYIRMGKLKK